MRGKSNDQLTARKIEHILDWASACKVKYVWSQHDVILEEYLKELRRKILKNEIQITYLKK